MDHNGGRAIWFGWKGSIGVALAALAIGATLYGLGIGIKPLQKPAAGAADRQVQKPVRVMNLALGPMVFLARELDFAVTNANGEKLDNSRVATRIETQLQSLRELYRQESARDARLLGSLTLQFKLSPAGEVSQVKAVAGRITDAEFQKTVIGEAAKWNLPDLVSEPMTVQTPLLFVQEGMDITTLVRWQGGFAGAPEKVAAIASAKHPEADRPTKIAAPRAAPTIVAKAAVAEKAPAPTVKSEGEEVQIKYATLLRKEPNFSSPALATITIGTKLHVVTRRREWLQVRSQHDGRTGFIRKEFVAPVERVAHW